MSQIQSAIGLITGVPILDTVDRLMAIAARPRDLLTARNSTLQTEQLAVNTLSSLLLGVQFEVDKLKVSDLFHTKTVTSSNSDILAAALATDGAPAAGTYLFTPVQTATAHQLLSSRFGGTAPATGVGSFTFQRGGFVDEGVSLDALNAGEGVTRGEIRITDRSGATAIVDLRFARSVDDVLQAINSSATFNVTATTDGDSLKLTDNTGQTASNLIVQEVNGGTTAAELGIGGINVPEIEETGSDALSLHDATRLTTLNDGNGVQLRGGADLAITLQDETVLEVDLGSATTLGDVIDALNAADPTRLASTISAGGDRIELTDLTVGGGTLVVENADGGTAAEDLGLTETAVAGVVTSRRLLAGLKTSLLSGLNGGDGLSPLGIVSLTDRSGATADVDLSSAETLDDVIATINAAGVGITASVNRARNGIELADTTGATVSNLVVANGDATNTADAFGISIDSAVDKVDGGPLRPQTVSEATLLSSLNDGDGVDIASFTVTDSAGHEGAVVLDTPGSEITNLGELIEAINGLAAIDVEASLNDTGDGILLVDKADGTGTLTVEETGNHTTAADLGLLGAVKTVNIEGTARQVVDTTGIHTVEIANSISLSALNAGQGVDLGEFTITDTAGTLATIDLDPPVGDTAATIGDVVEAINAADASVVAQINETGDGILLIDTAGGGGTLTVAEVDSGTTAADLGLLGTGEDLSVDGSTVHGIDGSGTFDSTVVDHDALGRVATQINALGVGVVASRFFDGDSYRLSLSADASGKQNELLVDARSAGYSFDQTSAARDALLLLGTDENAAAGILTSSATNDFQGFVEGVDLTLNSSSLDPITIVVSETDADLIDAIKGFVSAYNSLRDTLGVVTDFDAETLSTGILFGSNAALRVDTDLANLVTGRFSGVGTFQSLEEIGIEIDDEGKLSLDESKLSVAFAEDAASLETMFSHESLGVAAKFDALVDQLAGEENSLLTTRNDTLSDKIDRNNDRIAEINVLLSKQRTRLLQQFFRMEDAVARMQADLAVIQGIQAVRPLSL